MTDLKMFLAMLDRTDIWYGVQHSKERGVESEHTMVWVKTTPKATLFYFTNGHFEGVSSADVHDRVKVMAWSMKTTDYFDKKLRGEVE